MSHFRFEGYITRVSESHNHIHTPPNGFISITSKHIRCGLYLPPNQTLREWLSAHWYCSHTTCHNFSLHSYRHSHFLCGEVFPRFLRWTSILVWHSRKFFRGMIMSFTMLKCLLTFVPRTTQRWNDRHFFHLKFR